MRKRETVKRLLLLSLGVAFMLALPSKSFAQKPGYKIRFEIKNFVDTACFLAYRSGESQYLKDTFDLKKAGEVIEFSGSTSLAPGVYSAVNARKQFMFEFLVDFDEQHFTITTDTADFQKLDYKNAPQNTAFNNYRSFVQARGMESSELRTKIGAIDKESPEGKKITAQLDKIDTEVKALQAKLMTEFEGKLIAYILKAQQSPTIPKAPEGAPTDFAYQWFKAHYWDNFDFTDDRIVRSPIYHAKLKYYFEKMIIQHPDSVNKEVDIILGKTKANKEFYKQTFVFLYQKYNSSEIVCMDKVYVNLALNWYTKELAFWATDNQIKKIKDRAIELAPIRCGEIAPNMRLKDTLGGWHELYSDPSKFIVLYFWDPDCGHCKKSTPLLPPIYDKYKSQGVNFWGICTKFNTKEWRDFIQQHNLNFLNISDNAEDTFLNNMRDTYDIFSTPVVYVLDKDKRIVTKRISVEQLDDWLKVKLEEEKKKGTK